MLNELLEYQISQSYTPPSQAKLRQKILFVTSKFLVGIATLLVA